jgi:D-alanyl-D-alanine carboxypeptidase (penicillin-binding protein 5/6)
MKKHIAMLCAVLLTALAAFAPGAAAAGPALTATEAYCIIDADTGLVLAQQNMNEELHPASITKVMTLGLACEKAQGKWDNVKLTVSHEDVYSLAGTDSSHIALQEGEEVPLTDALYATMMASANDGANLLAEYFGGGSIEGGVAAMNAQAKELGLEHTHFANPHGISDEDHYTSCYDMAQILRWALTQPGFETLFTRNEMYTMGPTNVQPVTRYFHQQDKMRVGSSRYYIPAILGSKIGYTNIARYSYVCLAEQNGVRLICVTMQSQIKTDKYNDVRTLLDDAFARYTGYTEIPAQGVTGELEVAGGGSTLGTVTVSDPGVKLLLADGLTVRAEAGRIEKPTFGSTALGELVRSRFAAGEIDRVELVGLCTDICVISNALLCKAFCPELPVSVDAACCAGVTPENHRNALSAMQCCQIDVLNIAPDAK